VAGGTWEALRRELRRAALAYPQAAARVVHARAA
jgi:hypothetical protein